MTDFYRPGRHMQDYDSAVVGWIWDLGPSRRE